MVERKRSYEFFDHTADIGIRAQGATLQELFIHMAQGLTELLAEDSRLEPRLTRSISLKADDGDSLLLAWLQELLFWFSTDRFLPVEYALETVSLTALHGQLRGDTFDPTRHVQGREVKAITRHLLEVDQQDGVWMGQVIVDV